MENMLDKQYNPKEVEDRLYKKWEEKGYFHAEVNPDKEPFTIVIPPPNITGQLHMGHALDNMMQDAIIRFKRMQGYETLWMPGTDHASIATEVKIVEALKEEGLSKYDIGREKFLKRAWAWKEKYGGRIVEQLKKLGSSLDWQRERFTMDEGCSKAVTEVFLQLYNKGLIYRGNRIINWCPQCKTALSDAEVDYLEQPSHLWHIRYKVKNSDESLIVATTRPETMLGDTALAVNPEDERYSKLVGGVAILPVVGREIPIVADEYVEKEFGTGVVKITPAHDPNDFEVGRRHKLEIIKVMDEAGVMNENAGEYQGMDRFECRKKLVERLKEGGELVKIEDYAHNVGHCYRCKTVVEPMLSMQWFVNMKPLAHPAIKAVKDGEVRFIPERFEKTYFNWMENIKDWCISRQLWWGHRIPVWYRKDKAEELRNAPALDASALEQGFLYVGTEPPADPENWTQDSDVMDTWFSSWLWPFSTMDDETRAKFYPTTDLVTGPDIIFFWVARMIMAGYRFQHDKPFSNVFFTSIIRDKIGRKMSKSLGNSPDPLDLIANYGADGLRFGLMRIAPTGTDVRFDENQIGEGRNFANKLYNATRFRLMQGAAEEDAAPHYSPVHISIISKLKQLHADVEKALADYEFNALIQNLYQFFWNEYCDRFLEAVKGDLRDGADPAARAATLTTMDTVLRHYLALLHPVMPHITEELWVSLGFADANGGLPLMRTPLPSADGLLAGLDETRITLANTQAAALYETANKARNLKAEYDLSNNKNVSFILKTTHDVPLDILSRLSILANAKSVTRDAAYSAPKGTPAALTPLGELFLPLEGLIDVEAEKERLGKELDKIAREIAKSSSKLGNAGFVERAPAEVVDQEKARLADWEAKQAQLKGMLDSLS